MDSDQIRPTWILDGKPHPATFPAAKLDSAGALEAALALNSKSERMSDVQIVKEGALAYSAETMHEAIGAFAFAVNESSRETALTNSAGWLALRENSSVPSVIHMMLVHPEEPGGWHVSMRFQTMLTDEAAAQKKTLSDQVSEEHKALGLTLTQAVLRQLSWTVELSEAEKALADLKKSPKSYRSAGAGDPLVEVTATAITLKNGGWKGYGVPGSPVGVESAIDAPARLPVRSKDDHWWSGIELRLEPLPDYERDEETLGKRSGRSGSTPELPLMILSDFIVANDLKHLVTARDEDTKNRSFKSYGMAGMEVLTELGHALVHASGGLFDDAVQNGLAAFSAGIAAQDVSNYAGQFVALASQLQDAGYTDEEYSCNDGRTIVRGYVEGNTSVLHLETQHGNYLTRVVSAEDGVISGVQCFRDNGDLKPVGRFVSRDGILQEAYEGEVGEPKIIYNLRQTRDVNNIILGLSSAFCCLEEDLAAKTSHGMG